MTMPEFKKRHEWILKTDSFGIQVCCGRIGEDWVWTMYVLVYDNHPLYSSPEAVCDLEFHGGCTYDEKVTNTPARGIRYEWQKERSLLKVGCDYHHWGDEYLCGCDPEDGIPGTILYDARQLLKEMCARAPTAEGGSQ